MKLLVLSDLHLEFADFEVDPALEFDVAVLAGDIAAPGAKAVDWARRLSARGGRPVVLVPGNHEYYGASMPAVAQAMRGAIGAGDRVHLLDRGRVDLGGVRFLGCTLWTDFALRIDTPDGPRSDPARGIAAARRPMVDYRVIDVLDAGDHRPRKLTPEDTLALHHTDRAWLAAALAEPFDGPTVVVTHHGPHRGSLAARYADDWVSTAFISELPDAFFAVPSLWVHGHTHTGFDHWVGGCRIVCNPRGYVMRPRGVPENPRFNPGLVVEPANRVPG